MKSAPATPVSTGIETTQHAFSATQLNTKFSMVLSASVLTVMSEMLVASALRLLFLQSVDRMKITMLMSRFVSARVGIKSSMGFVPMCQLAQIMPISMVLNVYVNLALLLINQLRNAIKLLSPFPIVLTTVNLMELNAFVMKISSNSNQEYVLHAHLK